MKVLDSYKKKTQLQVEARYFVTSLIMVAFVFAVVFGVLGVGPVMAGQAEVGEKKETVKQPVEIEQTIVTATRTEIEVKEVPMSVEVVTREEIDALDADNVMDILRFSTGISFYRDKNYRTPMIRGFEGRHSLVLINGRRIASRSSGGDPFWFSTNNIERIEIVRGPASSLYGSDALGGVINIITKRPKKGLTLDFSTKYGSYADESDTTPANFIQVTELRNGVLAFPAIL